MKLQIYTFTFILTQKKKTASETEKPSKKLSRTKLLHQIILKEKKRFYKTVFETYSG